MAATRLLKIACATLLVAPGSALAAELEHIRTVGSSVAVDVGQAVGDLVAVDSVVQVDGVVRGHVYAIDSQVVLAERAIVLGSVTVNRGRLDIKSGAMLPKSIYLNDAGFQGPGGESIDFGQTVALADGATQVSLDKTVVSTVSVGLMKQMLPFERFVPEPRRSMDDLASLSPGPQFELRRVDEGPKEVTVGGIAKLTFVSDKVQGAFQRGYRGEPGSVLLTVVHLQDQKTAEALWAQVEAAGHQAKMKVSVKSGLGDGAHWFFKHRNRYCMMWQRGTWLIAVETRLADRTATLNRETQFSQRVLRSLGQQLSQPSAPSRGEQQ